MGWWLGDLVHHGVHVAGQFIFLFPEPSPNLPFASSGSVELTSFCVAVTCVCFWSLDRL